MPQAFFRILFVIGVMLLAARPAEARLFAIVVGVSEYTDPRLQRAALPGASADAEAIAAVLRNRGAAAPDLALIQGKAATADAIRSALSRVSAEAGAGDRVVLYLSGHGAQVPARTDDGSEPDRLDEIFLAADAGAWSAASKAVPGALLDDEFGRWIDQIRGKGASIWFIVDACNAGGLQRGVRDRSSARVIDPAWLSLPAPMRAGRSDFSGLADATEMAGGGKLVTFYAAPAGGIAWERPLPGTGGESIRRGVFTWSLLRALDGASASTNFLGLAGSADEARRTLGPPGGPAWIGGDLAQPILFTGDETELLAHARATAGSAPVALLMAVGPAGRDCPGADPDSASLAPPPQALRVIGCRRVLVDLRSTVAVPVTVRPWYRDSAGGYVALAGVGGVAVPPGANRRFGFTVMDRDPDTGRKLPSGTEYLLLISDQNGAAAASGAIIVPLTTGE